MKNIKKIILALSLAFISGSNIMLHAEDTLASKASVLQNSLNSALEAFIANVKNDNIENVKNAYSTFKTFAEGDGKDAENSLNLLDLAQQLYGIKICAIQIQEQVDKFIQNKYFENGNKLKNEKDTTTFSFIADFSGHDTFTSLDAQNKIKSAFESTSITIKEIVTKTCSILDAVLYNNNNIARNAMEIRQVLAFKFTIDKQETTVGTVIVKMFADIKKETESLTNDTISKMIAIVTSPKKLKDAQNDMKIEKTAIVNKAIEIINNNAYTKETIEAADETLNLIDF